MGILNSKLFVFLYRLLATESGRVLAQVKPTILKALPIRSIDSSKTQEQTLYNSMINSVDRMIALHSEFFTSKVPFEKTKIQRQIETTDRKIDELVYQLYGLTDDEIKLVEESTR